MVSAGTDQRITLPGTASLAGTISDDGLPPGSSVSSTWTKVSGPGTVTFANAASAQTTATFGEAGVYVLRLTASDSLLATRGEVTLTVPPPHPTIHRPMVSAGTDQRITLPGTASLAGTISDDGLPAGGALSASWSKVSGPGAVTFIAPGAATT